MPVAWPLAPCCDPGEPSVPQVDALGSCSPRTQGLAVCREPPPRLLVTAGTVRQSGGAGPLASKSACLTTAPHCPSMTAQWRGHRAGLGSAMGYLQ